ncbi:DUF2500 family protein [Paenibacillus donghaensis]|uniref:Uncharacterized protein n=1 Tax=Paenibacillus donghaensis TaxID=414771 RepID=A0A2Z2K4Z2_9BACL|nr:DUF2500 family protein [Paenibacillus donghaensis]ASA21066.1 hypothetical protein B9T62_09870 [Paenibacillus donghaensis]
MNNWNPQGVFAELQVESKVYGLIVEGDYGEITYQGTRFKDFRREGSKSFQ